MKLPVCWKCNRSFKYHELLTFSAVKCPKCKERNYVTSKKRLQNALYTGPVSFLGSMTIIHSNINPAIILIFLILPILAFIPTNYKFTNKVHG
ncbi:hypothetical protein BKP45_20615 [Anaerobacillus alkalidiazotrophicus]|uniref:Cxxc_20_cxxc protein n=1 Tax=Anaerobacillus alkalidiazotrophicus TaxID=472963 RepID=A0A1S2M0D4_9BACI|nr:TIGR04104 family putative zinc finger protein [Anaerobacillus alkalidiazotrophicus]OIJ17960.1 hypothetical protein BKP45_20615 [Anaerobacillus alkalidiazotrophicus]